MKGGASNPMGMLADTAGGKSQPRQGLAGAARQPVLLQNLSMRIGKDGTWYYQNTPINRLPLVKLFASALRRENDQYWIVTPAERGLVSVEDAPFTAVEVRVEGTGNAQTVIFRTNLDEEVAAGEDHPIRLAGTAGEGAPIPYIGVRDRLEARILRPVFYHLVELGEEQGDQFGVWSSGRFFPLGRLDSAL
jgi:uncharacterized protein